MKNPEGVACNDSSLVVADSGNGRLLRYSFQGNEVKGGTEVKLSQLTNPVRVQLTAKGDIYAFDAKTRRIIQVSPAGTFQKYVEPQGVPAPAAIISNFKIDGEGQFHMLDIFSERVLVLDQGGKFLNQIPFPKGYGFMIDLAVDGKGTIYLVDSTNGIIHAAPRGGQEFAPLVKNLREYVSFPGYITNDSRGLIYVVDQNGGGLAIFGQEGSFLGRSLSMGRKNGLLYYPEQICITGSGSIFVADRDNSRVQQFEMVK